MDQPTTTLINKLPIDPKHSLLALIIVGDRAIVERISPGEYLSKEAGIIRPVGYVDPYMKGRLIAFGKGEYGTVPPESMAVGQEYNYWHQAAVEFEYEDKKYDLVRVSDLFMQL